jgi:YggT family protein
MTDNRPVNETSVDRREETVVTQQPGYVASERVTRDVAAERRQGTFQVTQIIWTIAGILEIGLGLRFVLKLIAANPDAGFARLVYGLTQPFLAPFTALVGTPTSGGTVFEVTTLIAMAVYALLAWIIARVIQVATERPSARTTTQTISRD